MDCFVAALPNMTFTALPPTRPVEARLLAASRPDPPSSCGMRSG
jgi:hypothetical protein